MLKNFNVRQYDALVIGSGVTGLVAALKLAKKEGRSIAVVGDGVGASPYIHGFNMPLDEHDSPELFYEDTYKGGREQSDPALAGALCRKAAELFPLLDELGVSFDKKEDGSYSLLRPLGASVPRVASAGNHTGVSLLNSLNAKLKANENVAFFPQARALRLRVRDGRVLGAVVADKKTDSYTVINAGVTVLACGGFCNVFPFSTNSGDIGGDGAAMALCAGASLTDMEFVQFEPSAAVAPAALRGKSVITTMFYEGAVLRNRDGRRFMLDHSPEGECVNKDVQSRLIFREIAEGRGTENGGVYFDATGVGREKLDRLYSSYVKRYADVGIDIAETPFEIAPAAHTSLGGVRINPDCSVVGLSGLFACGEVTGGVHGANRLGGNAGLQTLVFGSIAGESAAAFADGFSSAGYLPCEAFMEELAGRPGEKPAPERLGEIRAGMQKILSEDLNVLREEKGLERADETLSALLAEVRAFATVGASFTLSLAILRLENDLLTALALARSARLRTETCGCHVRTDSRPEKEGKYRTVVSADADGALSAVRLPIEA
ncbi:MAG: FAD-binding protein [Clostridia bacterium]|nr:FAD-binding protein [Clostridia bacterium]